MEKNKTFISSIKRPPSRTSSSFNESSKSLPHPSPTEDSFDFPFEKDMLIQYSLSAIISSSFCEKKRKIFFVTSRKYSSSSDRKLQLSTSESHYSSLDYFFPSKSFETLHASSQEKVSSLLPSNIKEIDAVSSYHSSFISSIKSSLLRMKFLHVTSSKFESTSKVFESFYRITSSSILDSKVYSSPILLSSKSLPNLKTKKINAFLDNHFTITQPILKMIPHYLTLIRKYWNHTKYLICLHLKSSLRGLYEPAKHEVLLTLAHLPEELPRLKLQTILSLSSRL